MKQHTSDFKNQIKEMGRELQSIITYGNTELINELYSVKYTYDGNILKSVMKGLEIECSILIPKDAIINYKLGLKIEDEYEYLDYGNYVVKDIEKLEDTGHYRITCYDKILYSMKQYEPVDVQYPVTIREYITAICDELNIDFANEEDTFANYNRSLLVDPYEGLEYTYRDILDELAQVTGSAICINKDDELEIRYINNTQDTIDERYLKDVNVAFADKYGPVNSIVLSRSGESDNVFIQDGESVALNGLCEIKIVDNQIMNFNDRSDYLPDLLQKLDGLEYYINDFSSIGICYYDLLDLYNVNIQNTTYKCLLLNDEINMQSGLEEIIHTDMPEQSETDYTKADKTDRKINQTYLIVDKQNQQIQSLVNEIGDRSDKQTTITQDIESIELRISDIEDLTREVIGNNPITLENCVYGNLLQLKIRGNNTVFDQLYPANDLYPADNLYPRNGDSILHIYTDNKCIDTADKWENGYIGNSGQEYHSDPYNSAMIVSDYMEISQLSGYISLEDSNYKFYQVYCYTQDKTYINTSTSTFIRKQEGTINFRTNTKYIRVVIVNKDFHYNETGYENNYPEITADEILEAKPMLTYTNEKTDYVQYYDKQIDLGIREVLRQYSSTVYDEFIYDYEDEEQRAKVIHRVGITSGGTLYPLAEEVIEPLEIEDIIVIKGKNILDLNSPYIANMYARYVELNGFTEQFATTYEVESAIIQLANSITLLLREKVNKEEVIAELNLEITEGKGIVRITGNQVIIDSDYFHLTADGQITATKGYIGNLTLSSGYLYKDFTVGGINYQSGLYIPADDTSLNSIFLFAGKNQSDNTYNLKIGHNGVIIAKYITVNNDYGYLEMVYDDTGKVAMALKNTQLEFRLNDNANTLFGRIFRSSNDLTIGILGALGFCIRDELHSRNLYNIDTRQGNAPYHYFTGEMWMDRDLDGTFVQVAQNGDWSDRRLKKDIEDSESNALDIIDKMKFKQFTWNEKTSKADIHVDIGLIAQDIQEIDENYVETTSRIYQGEKEELLSIDVLNLLTTTAKAVQELNQIVKQQQEEIQELQEELNKLKGGIK